MSVLVHTNVLLRRLRPTHPHHPAAVESVARPLNAGATMYVTPQNIAEFWTLVTRPVMSNGLGFSLAIALSEVGKIERSLTLSPDSPATYAEWKRLVIQHAVLGGKVHDTRLVAAMMVHGVNQILTFTGEDFSRYGIVVLLPNSI